MNRQHRDLSTGRWQQLSLVEQMANIGGEVERALTWQAKGNAEYSWRAVERALELVDLTLLYAPGYPRRKELARVREALLDYFCGGNTIKGTAEGWRRYFLPFGYAARRQL